ncbi:chaplin [Streptomyces prasinus]|uniref:chaplin n=1 Tax=Streptomyces prasinus TaxID=67345 RepID=UPI00362BCFB6
MRAFGNAGLVTAAGAIALGAAATASADDDARGTAIGSPGVASGNVIHGPVHIPVNACGNTVDVIGLLDPALGNTCAPVSDSGWETGRS